MKNYRNYTQKDLNAAAAVVAKYESKMKYTRQQRRDIINNIREFARDLIKRTGLKSFIIGMSGGIDSTIVAALLQEKYTGIPLIGVTIPLSSTISHIEKAEWAGKQYCSFFENFDDWEDPYYEREEIENNTYNSIPLYERINQVMNSTSSLAKKAGFEQTEELEKITQGNIKARLRMITLYDLAKRSGGLVLSCSQASEEACGFFTICGDVGDFAPIKEIFKSMELIQLAEELKEELIEEKDKETLTSIIAQDPSDGLGVTEENTDEAQLGMDYKTFDAAALTYIEANKTSDFTWAADEINVFMQTQIYKDAVKRIESTQFKRDGVIKITKKQLTQFRS